MDFLDEENLWDQLRWKCDAEEWGLAFLEAQVARLRYFGEGVATPPLAEQVVHSPVVTLAVEAQVPPDAPTLTAASLASLSAHTDEASPRSVSSVREGTLLVASSPSAGGAEADTSDDERQQLVPTVVLQKYFISTSGSARKRRLHLGGACWRIPGRDYADFTEHGDEIPGSGEYHAACRQCFPDGLPSSSDGSSVTSDAEST